MSYQWQADTSMDKQQGSPAGYITLNASVDWSGASEITGGSLKSLTLRLLE